MDLKPSTVRKDGRVAEPHIPTHIDLMWPTLEAIRGLGGSGTINEIATAVIELEGFSVVQQAVQHADTERSEIEYRLAWARSYLRFIEALENSSRGVWSITATGREIRQEAIPKAVSEWRRLDAERRREREGDMGGVEDEEPQDWKSDLLAILTKMDPEAFERLSQRLLREAGFVNVEITARSGDGGIDGIGVYRLSLVSFPVFFQCKRYRGSVGPGVVRDFRGAMVGRGEKGLLITTGRFTSSAEDESTRDGAPPIELIDGDRLCDLLKTYELGVQTKIRTEEDIELAEEFFDGV